jgi:AraC-like DNA-binding protein
MDPDLPWPTFFVCARAAHLANAHLNNAGVHRAVAHFRARLREVARSRGPLPAKVAVALERLQATGSNCRPLSEESVASEVGLSSAQLGRLIKRHTGMSFVEWRWLIQLQPTMRLIIGSDELIARVAEQTGYPDPSSPWYKSVSHMTPVIAARR